MKRMDFVYKKPIALAMQADEVAQQAYMDWYENLLNSLLPNDEVLFSDAVHPEHQSRPAHGWFPKNQKTAIKTTSDHKRFNLQGALNLDGLKFISVRVKGSIPKPPFNCLKRSKKGSVNSCLEICPRNAFLAPPGPHRSEGVAGTEMRAGRRK